MTAPAELAEAVAGFARSRSALIICDYDGTLAPLVDEPDRAFPDRRAVQALQALAELGDTHVAVVSGRSLRDLEALCSFPPEIHRVGSHGSEYDDGFEHEFDDTEIGLLARIAENLQGVAAGDAGFIVEIKPVSVAFHYRKAEPSVAHAALEQIRRGPAGWPGVRIKEGKKVIELAVVDADKGTAVDRLRDAVAADSVLFVGDDVTDEDAFGVLRPSDIGIKVGQGATLARYRLADTDETADLLSSLAALRRAWLDRNRTT